MLTQPGTRRIVVGSVAGAMAIAAAYRLGGGSAGSGPVTAAGPRRRFISVTDGAYGAKGDGTSDDYAAIASAWFAALNLKRDLYFPAGIYVVREKNFPFRQEGPPAALLDCNGITIYGDGPSTVLKTVSVSGADVLQLNGLKNFHVRDLKIMATVSGRSAGSNGISVTGGYDDISLLDVDCENLAYLDKATHLDGGKALTIQLGASPVAFGTLRARVRAKGCVHGVSLEVDLAGWAAKQPAIDVELVAEHCYQGVLFSAGEALSALPTDLTSGFVVRALLIDCQHNVIAARAHGIDVSARVVTTRTADARRLNPKGGGWNVHDDDVVGVVLRYAKNSRFAISGDIGECDFKARIGAATAGASGLGPETQDCDIMLDLGGRASVAEVDLIMLDGRAIRGCNLQISGRTTAAPLPAAIGSQALGNRITRA